ncbi:RluA family pseudouridine synthase [Lachnoclostridium edouardi]|uniref:RluA family pseudouridine synthase n=1 Tax=Lachnoclostridium edouardi TaxID=1926283 RepID=UPI000C7E5549|nr:RluA family pseudouridine synthase [Lachnoclostridium edouardi]
MKKIICYNITEKQAGKSVELFLKSLGYSKNIIVHLRNTPMGLTVSGDLVYTTYILKAGQKLTVTLIEEQSSHNIVPVPMKLSIVYEDEDILVVNKQAGVPIHPSQGNFSNTLANGLAWYFQEKGQAFVYRAINRLDRDTTGLLIVAKHMLSACILSAMVASRQIHREYLAVVRGMTLQKGQVEAPIARVHHSTIERCVNYAEGDKARTFYKRLCYNPDCRCSLLSLHLESGRTHQIRVHMKAIGHPLPGDFLYNPDYHYIRRQALHSHRLKFSHPLTGEKMCFTAPIPEDMKFALSPPDFEIP